MNVIFYRWHPEVALRYLPIVNEIKKMEDSATILEVGSGGLGISPYLGKNVTGVDLEFSPPYHPLLKRVKGSALKIPFNSSSFDIVISVDTLEHIKPSDRQKAIFEMIRVSRQKAIIGVPSGDAAQKQDDQLDRDYKRRYGKPFRFLDEQVSYGLPDQDELLYYINNVSKQLKKEIKVTVKRNENLILRKFLMQGWMSNNIFVNILHRKFFLLLIPIFRLMNQEPTYRVIFLLDLVKQLNENSN